MEHFIFDTPDGSSSSVTNNDTDTDKPSGLRNGIIAAASAGAVVLALVYVPDIAIAFAAGVLTALWFNPTPDGEDDE